MCGLSLSDLWPEAIWVPRAPGHWPASQPAGGSPKPGLERFACGKSAHSAPGAGGGVKGQPLGGLPVGARAHVGGAAVAAACPDTCRGSAELSTGPQCWALSLN